MSELAHDLLIREFLAWVAERRRTYAETMEAWQSTCPRHTIWEDAVIAGYVQIKRQREIGDPEITLTALGREQLNGNHR